MSEGKNITKSQKGRAITTSMALSPELRSRVEAAAASWRPPITISVLLRMFCEDGLAALEQEKGLKSD